MPDTLEDLSVDQVLAAARAMQPQVQLLQQLSSNPETRESLQRLIKKVSPTTVIPEIDAADRVLAVVNAQNEKIDKLTNSILERDIRERLAQQKRDVQERYQLTSEDMSGVEALMVDKDNPIPGYDAAARVFKASRVSATPTAGLVQPMTYDMPERDVWGKGIGNKAMLDKIGLNQAYAAWNEMLTGKVPGLGAQRAGFAAH